MLFNSLEFALFFPFVTLLYFVLPHRVRWALLLGASAWFYMAFVPVYILILGFTILVDYVAGLLIENAAGRRRGWYLALSVLANVGVLAVFKYWNFLATNVNDVFLLFDPQIQVPLLALLLPIGLSFHTFQAMSYTIEVYRGTQPAERNLGIYALYVLFYPQLVAGPIERPQNLLHQFREVHQFDADRVFAGLSRMLAGLFKKLVIADRLAIVVNGVYGDPTAYSAGTLLLATWLYAVQIYCDFSGYSDIALGAANVMGFTLMENFDRPYFATSIGDFWRRWHISLSTWFKDYLYVPLGQPDDALETRSQSAHRVHDLGSLARGGVDVRHLGSSARRLSGVFGGDEPAAAAVGRGVAPESPGLGIDRSGPSSRSTSCRLPGSSSAPGHWPTPT